MGISIFDLFSIGIGPSSSHTVGPMRAARDFVRHLSLDSVHRVAVHLYGSLALTGKGHATDKAILMGLEGETPEQIDPSGVDPRCESIAKAMRLCVNGQKIITFDPQTDLVFCQRERLPQHANGMRLQAYDQAGVCLQEQVYFSIGGGFILTQAEMDAVHDALPSDADVPYPFSRAHELLAHCSAQNLTIADIMRVNEQALHPDRDIEAELWRIAQAMTDCIERGCHQSGVLPGGLKIERRAPKLYQKLNQEPEKYDIMNWINVYALAVNEENAAGGRVVTAPTNGAAGVIPAVLHAYREHMVSATETGVLDFLLTAGAIAILYKKGASISAAEVGCQGEIGVACSMAAGALVAALGGSTLQVENAAEMGMEHHLGLTCDPIKGLVQIPCIERNAMAAVQAVNAAKLALLEDGHHKVSLDEVIATMLATGESMNEQYKETSLGGLAVKVKTPEC